MSDELFEVPEELTSRMDAEGILFPSPAGESALKMWKPKEAADRLRVRTRTIYAWIVSGRLSAIRTPGGQIRIPASEVFRLLNTFTEGEDKNLPNTP